MTSNALATELATEHRRVLPQNTDDYRRARAARSARRLRRVGRLAWRVRPIRPDDTMLLADMFTWLAASSRLDRVLCPKNELTATELRDFADVDHRDHEALIAVTRLRDRAVGVARFVRNREDLTSAHTDVVEVDEWQGRGVGSMLATRLAARALRENISHFTAMVSAGNVRARRLLATVGDVAVAAHDGATVSYRVALPESAIVRTRRPLTPRSSRLCLMSGAVPTRRGGSTAAILAVLSAAAAMATLDLFVVNVAFPAIDREFAGASLADVSWVLNGYAVVYAALLVPLGRLADRYGRRGGYSAGLVLFTVASAACAAAPSLWSLVLFRGLQAIGAAALTPTSLGLLLAATPVAERTRAVRTWAAIGALAAATGPVVGGLLVQASWRWIFVINVPVGVVALLLVPRLVPDSRDPLVTKLPDLLGAGLIAVGIGSLALGLVKAPEWGWTSPLTLASYGVAVVSSVAFMLRSARHPLPVVELSLLRVRTLAWANVVGILYSVAFAGALLAAVVWMQDVWRWSALRTGLAIAPGPLMVPVFTAVAQRLSRRVSASVLASAGCLMFAIGTALIALRVGIEPEYVTDVLPGWLVVGAGAGLAMPTIFSTATVELPAARTATGSAIVTMVRQIGLTLGVSLLVMTIGTPTSSPAAHDAFLRAWWGVVVLSAAAATAALGMRPAGHGAVRLVVARLAMSRHFARAHPGPIKNCVTR